MRWRPHEPGGTSCGRRMNPMKSCRWGCALLLATVLGITTHCVHGTVDCPDENQLIAAVIAEAETSSEIISAQHCNTTIQRYFHFGFDITREGGVTICSCLAFVSPSIFDTINCTHGEDVYGECFTTVTASPTQAPVDLSTSMARGAGDTGNIVPNIVNSSATSFPPETNTLPPSEFFSDSASTAPSVATESPTSGGPTVSMAPTTSPTRMPSANPTSAPTPKPSLTPSSIPSGVDSNSPSTSPTLYPRTTTILPLRTSPPSIATSTTTKTTALTTTPKITASPSSYPTEFPSHLVSESYTSTIVVMTDEDESSLLQSDELAYSAIVAGVLILLIILYVVRHQQRTIWGVAEAERRNAESVQNPGTFKSFSAPYDAIAAENNSQLRQHRQRSGSHNELLDDESENTFSEDSIEDSPYMMADLVATDFPGFVDPVYEVPEFEPLAPSLYDDNTASVNPLYAEADAAADSSSSSMSETSFGPNSRESGPNASSSGAAPRRPTFRRPAPLWSHTANNDPLYAEPEPVHTPLAYNNGEPLYALRPPRHMAEIANDNGHLYESHPSARNDFYSYPVLPTGEEEQSEPESESDDAASESPYSPEPQDGYMGVAAYMPDANELRDVQFE